MVIDKNRHLIILHQLINASSPVASVRLAQLTLVTAKTVKYDISLLNEKLKAEKIAEIVSYKGKGYTLLPLNEKKFNEFKLSLTEMHILFQDENIEVINRRLYILQKLLSDEHVKTEDLVEELYTSKSVITGDLAWVNRFLQSYYIYIRSTSGKGLYVKGQEQDIRSAMVEVYVSLYQHYQVISPNTRFQKIFHMDRQEYNQIRKDILDLLRLSQIQLTELNSSKLLAYVVLAKSRSELGKVPQLPEKRVEELRETCEYALAQKIAAIPLLQHVMAKEAELMNLSRLLILYRDIDLRDETCLATLPKQLVAQNHRIFSSVIAEIREEQRDSLLCSEQFQHYAPELEALQMRIFLEHYFDHTSGKHLFWFAEESECADSPKALEYVRILILKLQNYFGETISSDTIASFVSVFQHILNQIELTYHKRKLIVTSMEGLITSRMIKECIEKRFPAYVDQIELYNLYEMRKLDLSKYDAVIHSGITSYFNYPIKCESYRELNFAADGDERLFDRIFVDGYPKSQAEKLEEMLRIYRNEKVSDINRFLELLSYKYCKENSIQPQILTNILEKDKIIKHLYTKSGIYLLPFDYKDTGTEFLDIYEPAQNLYYNGMLKVKYILAACVSPEITLSEARVLDMILQYLVNRKNEIDRLVSGETRLTEVFCKAVKNDFLLSV